MTAAALAVLTASMLATCGTVSADEGTTKITLCLDWTPNTNHTGFYVALANGYYADENLEVEIVQPPESGAPLMCAAGQAQFAINAQDTLAAAFVQANPINVTTVAALLQHNTSGIMSRKGEGMDTAKGLEGHTYSTWDNPIEQATIRQIMENEGGDFDKVTLIPNNVTDEAGALRENQTDALWVFYGWGGISAELSGLDFDFINFADTDPVFDYYTPVLIANNDFLESEPETAKAFLAATAKGYEYAIENPEEAAQMLIDGDTTGALKSNEELVMESQKWISGQYKADVDRWGYIDPERWNGFYRWLNDNELVENPLPDGTGFTNDYLP